MKKLSSSFVSYAKINLGLAITAKRPNGYHELCSLFIPIGLYDNISIELKGSDCFSCQIYADGFFVNDFPCNENNILYKTAKLVSDKTDLKFKINIYVEKNIPIGAGLGGGSSNAAALLNELNKLLSLKYNRQELIDIALSLGADVPFFLDPRPALVEGIGEKIRFFEPIKNYNVLIVKPSANISTSEIFNEYIFDLTLPLSGVNNFSRIKDMFYHALSDENIISKLNNDLEIVALKKCDKINLAKKCVEKFSPLVCMMSGSGSAVFGLFDVSPKIEMSLVKDTYSATYDGENFLCITKFIRRT